MSAVADLNVAMLNVVLLKTAGDAGGVDITSILEAARRRAGGVAGPTPLETAAEAAQANRGVADLPEVPQGPRGGFPGVRAKGVLGDIADTALGQKSLLAPDIPATPDAGKLNAELHRIFEASKGHRPDLPVLPTSTQRALLGGPAPKPVVGSLPRTKMSGLIKALGLIGAGAGATVAAPPLLRAAAVPAAAPAATGSDVNPWLLAGIPVGLAGLGIGGYMLNRAMKKKRDVVDKLDEDNEVL